MLIIIPLFFISGASATVPIADFTVFPTSGSVSSPIAFSDTSAGSPTGWAWFFGDETYTQAWTQQTASAGWSQRSEHKSVAMADGSIVLMGGYDGTVSKNDVWRSTNNGTTWTQVNASPGWSARHSHSSVVMPDNSIILTGGWDGNFRNDVWKSTDNGMTWTQVTANAGWTARAGHNSVALPDGTLVIFGGNTAGGYKNDVWQSTNNGLTWTQRTASAAWTAREDPSSVAMPDGSIVLMGGQDSSGYRNDVWRSTDKGAGWTQVKGSTDWAGRWRHNTVVMPDGSIVLVGGRSGSNIYNDVWRSTDTGSTWTRLTSAAGWSGRSGPSSVVIPDGSLILMGGNPNNAHINDVWRLMPSGSSAQNPSHIYTSAGTYPVTLQAYNSEGFNSTRKTGLITVTRESVPIAFFTASPTFGFVPMSVQFNDTSTGNPTVWNWSFGDGRWFNTTNVLLRNATNVYTSPGTYTVRLIAANTAGTNTTTHTDYLVVHGAKPLSDFSADVTSGFAPLTVSFTDQSSDSPTGRAWFFGDETYTHAWTQQIASAGWAGRTGHSSVVMPDGSIVLMGGNNDNGNLNDVWRSVDNGTTWKQMTSGAGWTGRFAHSSVAMPDGSIVVMGGQDLTSGSKNDVWRSADYGATWTLMNASAGWSGRLGLSSVALPDGSIVLTGGSGNSGNMNDVWRSADYGATWTLMNASAGWLARAFHTSVAMPDGSIVVMGGNYRNDVWRSTDNGATWTEVNASAGWLGRECFSSVAMPDGSIVVMGGAEGHSSWSNDVWRSADYGATWTEVNASAGWSARWYHSSVAMPDGSIVVMGGAEGYNLNKNDVWRFTPTGSSAQNPSHIYTAAGTYPVTLQTYNSGGFNRTQKTGLITVTIRSIPVANFTATRMSGTVPMTVQFNDTSTGNPTLWNWSFGDGSTSPDQDPVHTYTAAGIYTVNLTVGNPAGNTTVTKAGLITAAEAGVDSAYERMTVNTTILLKGNSFQVTAEGKANANYYLIIENASVMNTLLPAENYPAIVPNQNKVNISPAAIQEIRTALSTWSFMGEPITAADGTMAIITTNNTGKRTIEFTTSSPTKDYTFVLLLFRKSAVISGMYEITDETHVTVRSTLPPALTSGETQVTSTQTGKSEYVVNGDRVAWTDTRSGYPEIYLLNRTTGAELRITQADSGKSTPVLARDLIVWTDYRNGQPAIYGYSPDIRTEFRIGSGYYPSKDKDRLVYQDSRNNAIGVYLFNLTTRQETLLSYAQNLNQPKISGDIVVWYLQNSGYGQWQFEIYNLTTGTRNPLPVTMSDWSYSLNGDRLAYVRDNQVYVYNISTGTESQITHTLSNKNEATLSGSLLAWGDTRNGQTDIYWTDLVSRKEQPGCLDTAAQYAPQISDNELFWMDFRFGKPEILSSGIASGNSGQSPVADFTVDKTSGIAPMTVMFNDTSTGSPTEWFWDFGDGSTSTQQNATHTYGTAGAYSVNLTSKNSAGANLATKPDYITVTAAPSPTLGSITPPGGINTGAVAITDLKGTGFAVGAIVDLVKEGYAPINATDVVVASPTRITCSFNLAGAAPGLWEVAVTNPGAFTEAKSMFTVTAAGVKPVAAFSAGVTSGPAPLTVAFTDASTNFPTSWNWTFGDGNTINSTVQNPVHTYKTVGDYTVSLTAENSAGNSTASKTRYITVTSAGPAYTVPDRYATIQAAVNAANTGDTITVRSGYYNEHVLVAKPISLTGVPSTGQGRPVINGTGTGIPVTVTASGVNLTGFTVTNSNDAGILLKSNKNLLEDIWVQGNTGDGIRFDTGSSQNVLININSSTNGGSGIVFLSSASNNTLENCTAAANQWHGMYLWYDSNNNVLRNVTADRSNYGITVQGNHGNSFTHITSTHNTEYGISFDEGAYNNYLADSLMSDNQARGIFLFNGPHDNVITNTTITGNNGWAGINVNLNANNNLIYNNYFNNARNYLDQSGTGSSSVNIWNVTPAMKTNIVGGPVTAGNYWADLGNTGFSQTTADTNNDGICDAPFTLGGQNRDSLPLHTYMPKTPTASFTTNSTSGSPPLTILFTDTSAGFPTRWLWDFGDGNTSTQRIVTHTFTTAGTYTINLTAANAAGSNTAVKTNYITVRAAAVPTVAAFRANKTEGDQPLTVKFIDASSNTPTSWTWDFGDGSSSAEQNPIHLYTLVGNYTVNLTAANPAGSNSTQKTRYITVIAPVVETNRFVVTGVQTSTTGAVQNVTITAGSNVTTSGNVVTISNPASWSSLAITLAAPPVTGGTTINGTVETVKAVTEPVTVPIESVGTPTVQISLNMSEMPGTTASITQTITKDPDATSQSSFSLAATSDGKQIDDIAYTLNIVKTNLANAGDGGIIQSATLTMTVSPAWIADHGGIDHIVVMRKAEDGTTQMLIPQQTGIDADGNIILSVYSPKGLSIFILAAISASHASDSSGSTVSSSNSYSSSDSGSYTSVSSQPKSTSQLAPVDPNSYPWTTQSINGPTHITKIELQPIGTFKDLFILTEKPGSLPNEIPSPGLPVYEYHKIDLYHATRDDINQAVIEFTVSQSHLDSQKMTYRDVQLLRYHDKEWERLPTEYAGKKDGGHLYRAKTTGFSYFATVLAKDATILTATTTVPTLAIQQSAPATPAAVSNQGTVAPAAARTQAAPPAAGVPEQPKFPFPIYLVGIIGIIVLVVCGFFINRWRIRQQNPDLFRDEPFFGRRR